MSKKVNGYHRFAGWISTVFSKCKQVIHLEHVAKHDYFVYKLKIKL